ncbi:molybdenum ABC transporter ATP-binding protein [Thalassobius sp. S69A]|uniref:molybdenum ABC transporter ATP-binding protein n=1 Tax=unclassified Thalassovita TaxID=2619711 RepID=UPI000C0CDD67|nr:molybdenum ABC transporter ATP-binding protein [Paracoccaceae bacterium]MBT26617.1 molybdenum ABC transporter ATP-binding protein [Paracoccaceae bacterium]
MSISVRIQHDLGEFRLDARFQTETGVTAIFGRSGSGKTTLINAIAGLLRPDRGEINLQGRPVFDSARRVNLPAHKRRVGYVFQDARLFPHLNVRQNLRYGQRFQRRTGLPEQDVIEMLGIGPLLHRHPGALSGGEKQRVAIGRALLSAPDILLMDEPLAALDAARKEEILPYLERLRDRAGLPILYVSHAMSEIARLANTLVLIENGKTRHYGPLSQMLSDPHIAPLIGLREAGAVLKARVQAHHDDGLTQLQTAGGALLLPHVRAGLGTELRIRIHAHEVMLSLERPRDISALNVLPATVQTLRQGDGPGALVRLQCGPDTVLARITRRSAKALQLRPGTACYAIIKSVSVAQADVGGGQTLR